MAEPESVPSPAYRRLVERHATRVSDPVARLKFVRQANRVYRPGLSNLFYSVEGNPPRVIRVRRFRPGWAGVTMLALVFGIAQSTATRDTRLVSQPLHSTLRDPPAPSPGAAVWLVEKTADSELYSNGLRIENRNATRSAPRYYRAWSRRNLTPGEWRTDPAGIVFHTTESTMAPFEAMHNSSLRHNSAGLLKWVEERKSYHFVIDRFGRVHRVVAETDYANHCGHSVWSDGDWVYIGLNQSFFGISFEAAASNTPGKAYRIGDAQLHAGRILSDMLRVRYRIAAANCVTHAQVSVNPQNMTIGYHTDWAGDFPFQEMGLSAGYDAPVASIAVFGFTYDSSFLHAIGRQVWRGMVRADEQILEQAATVGVAPGDYRASRHRRFHEILAELRRQPTGVSPEEGEK